MPSGSSSRNDMRSDMIRTLSLDESPLSDSEYDGNDEDYSDNEDDGSFYGDSGSEENYEEVVVEEVQHEIRYGFIRYLYQLNQFYAYNVIVPVVFLVVYPQPSYQVTEATEGEDACYVCCVNRPNATLPNCGHTGICCACASRLMRSQTPRCPLCRAMISHFDVVGN
jgi:hypothetical protein